jgi:hypothetical protein
MKSGKPFAITEFGPPGDGFDNTSPRNFDYGPFANTWLSICRTRCSS